MEKIEKLQEFNWLEGRDALTIALDNTIIKKLNEVIDYLNSKEFQSTTQDTPEEELTDKKKDVDKGVDREDTPEEWEKKISTLVKEGLFEEVTDDKGERVLGYIGCSDKVLKEIKQLLDDREREVLEKERTEVSKLLMKHACNEVPDNIPFGMDVMVREVASEGRRIWAEYEEGIGKIEKLDKLNSKKK